ncbi:hypothetical protein Aperf_G00000005516 [Anoplocephala perfoliata]
MEASNLEQDGISGADSKAELDDDQVAQISFSWWNAIFLIVFGVSSWVAINGLWMELPSLVNVLPEGWDLPAYLSIIIQLANIGPLLYVLLTRICRRFGRAVSGSWFMRLIQPPERLANYVILIVGLTSSLLLTRFWDAVVLIPWLPENTVYSNLVTNAALHNHSLGLFVLTFLLGMLDCMSSVTFLAYLANMPPVHAGALLFGETASGLLPSLYALGQGVYSEPHCVPTTNENGTTGLTAIYDSPNFSVSVFMSLIAVTTGLSLLAFLLLDCLPMGLGRSVTLAYQRHHSLPTTNESDDSLAKVESPQSTPSVADDPDIEIRGLSSNGLFWICFFLVGYTSCLTNGLLSSMQSYSTAAYSTTTFHLAVTLSGITAPFVALAVTAFYGNDQMFLLVKSVITCRHNRAAMTDLDSMKGSSQWGAEALEQSKMSSIIGSQLAIILSMICLIGSVFAAYIIYLAAASPKPPSLGGAGPAFAEVDAISAGLRTGVICTNFVAFSFLAVLLESLHLQLSRSAGKQKCKKEGVKCTDLEMAKLGHHGGRPELFHANIRAQIPAVEINRNFTSAERFVLAWILMTAAFNIQNTWITLHLVKYGTQRNLRTLGIARQSGSIVGALISFLITAVFKLFVSKTPCT